MDTDKAHAALDTVYGAGSTDALDAAHAAWAASYDSETASLGYLLPFLITAWVTRYVAVDEGPLLDAGCGTGAMSIELARRGADVLGIDLAPEIIRFAAEPMPHDTGAGRIEFKVGDMLSREHGAFDAVVAMDSLIHYQRGDAVLALSSLARRTRHAMVFTFAPRTPLLSLMHATGRLFPRSDRAPSIVPVRPEAIAHDIAGRPELNGWRTHRTERVSHGFYTSQMMEIVRS